MASPRHQIRLALKYSVENLLLDRPKSGNRLKSPYLPSIAMRNCLKIVFDVKQQNVRIKNRSNLFILGNIFDLLYKFREKLVKLLLNIQFKILDFILEPADKLFPATVTDKQPIQRFGGCSGTCCRSHLTANRSQSASTLSIKNKAVRYHQLYSSRRAISENFC